MNNTKSIFSRNGKNAFYQTTNSEYGSPWVQDNTRPQKVDIKAAVVPTFSEIVASMNDFKKCERLIKSKLVRQKLESEGINPNTSSERSLKKTEFPIMRSDSFKYPEQGLNVGPAIYRTNNMNYGSSKPADFELPNKYFPTNHTFTKSFCGGNYKFDGLNTAKQPSQIHDVLNEF